MKKLIALLVFILLSHLLFIQNITIADNTNKELDIQLEQAFKLFESKQFDEALKITQQVIEKDPQYWKGYWRVAQIYVYMKEGENAILNLQKAEHLGLPVGYKETFNYMTISAYISWGLKKQTSGDFEIAGEKFQKARTIAEENNFEDMERETEFLLIQNLALSEGGQVVPSETKEGVYDVIDPWGHKSMTISPQGDKETAK